MTGTTALPLIPYIRQSKAKEVTHSLDDQRDAIAQWARANSANPAAVPAWDRHGKLTLDQWSRKYDVGLAAEVVEQGVSGSISWQERELGAAVRAVTGWRDEGGTKHARVASGVIVAFQDRLSRENGLGTAEVWEALAGSRFVAAAEGTDTAKGGDGPDGELLFTIKAAVARAQWRRSQANWQTAVDNGIAAGRYIGTVPVGYDRADGLARGQASKVMPGAKDGRLVKNEHAVAVEQAFRIRANGGSWSEVARSLTEAGVPTSGGAARWSINSARSLLGNPIYKGELKNGHWHQFPAYVIIEPSVWDAVNPNGPRVTAEKRPQYTYTYDVVDGITATKIKYERRVKEDGTPVDVGRKDGGSWAVLAGLCFCGGCGRRLTPNRTRRVAKGAAGDSPTLYSYYQCKGVGTCDERAQIEAAELESMVAEAAYDVFASWVAREDVGLGRNSDTEKLGGLEIERDECARRLEKFIRLASLDDDGYEERLTDLREAKLAAERAVQDEKARTRRVPTTEEVRATIDTGTAEEKRQVIRQVLLGVTVWRKGVEPHDVVTPEGESRNLRGESLDGERIEVAWKGLAL